MGSTREELKMFPHTKAETSDYHSQHSESGILCFDDEIEIGEDFKNVTVTNKKAPENNLVSDENNMLIYCMDCDKTWKLSEKKGNTCPACKSVMRYKCGRCKKDYRIENSLWYHLNHDCTGKIQKFHCKDCDYHCYKKANLVDHIQAKHSHQDSNSNKCSKSGINLTPGEGLTEHPKEYVPECSPEFSFFRGVGQCNKCKKKFKNSGNLINHLKICGQLRDLKFFCDHCNYKCNFKNNLVEHITIKHLPREPNKCGRCKKVYLSKKSFKIHLKICGLSADSKSSLMLFSCDHCQHKTIDKDSLCKHIKAKHSTRVAQLNECKKCGKNYSWLTSLRRHLKICGQPDELKTPLEVQLFSCDHCNYNSKQKINLLNHIQSKHSSENFECTACGKFFGNVASLQSHKRYRCKKSRSFERFSCAHCDYKTNEKRALVNHIYRKHLPQDPNLNRCNKCGKSYSSHSNFSRHFKMCGRKLAIPKRLSCGHCEYKTDYKRELLSHISSKHLPRDLNSNKCSKCGKCYSSRSSLRSHSKRCGQLAKDVSKFKCFSCNDCSFKSNSKQLLANHMQMKHMKESFPCFKCKKSFGSERNLYRHSLKCKSSKKV